MTRSAVSVTGVGLVTAAGLGTEPTWRAVCAGRPTAGRDPELAGLPVDLSCRVPDFDADELVHRRSSLTHDRFVQLALLAAREAVADAGVDLDEYAGARVGVVLGSALGGVATWETQAHRMAEGGTSSVSPLLVPRMMHNMAAAHVAMDLGVTGPNLATATACASGATAVGTAAQLIRDGSCDVAVAGGTDAALTPLVAAGFARMGALSRRLSDPAGASRPFDADRDGFVMGEGSGVLVLERERDARARGARIRAGAAGYGASADAHHMTAPDPDGTGVLAAVQQALAAAELLPDDVGYVNAHGTSTPLNDLVEARTAAKLFPRATAVSSTKGVTGHTLGAAGAIEAALTVLAVERGVLPPTANLQHPDPEVELDLVAGAPREERVAAAVSNSFGFGGQNAVLVFTAA